MSVVHSILGSGVWLFLSGALLLVSCATNPAMDSYVERKIDRPFVPADGIRTFSVIGKGEVAKDAFGKDTVTYPFPIPLYYTFTLFDNVEVEAFGFPLAIDWQIENNPSGFWGLTAGTGFGTSPAFGFYWEPTLGVIRKVHLTDSVALSGALRIHDAYFVDGGPTSFGADFTLAPEVQAGPWLWLQAGVVGAWNYTSAYSKVNGNLVYWTKEGINAEFPLFAGLSLTAFRTFDLSAAYTFSSFGRSNGTLEHHYSIGLTRTY